MKNSLSNLLLKTADRVAIVAIAVWVLAWIMRVKELHLENERLQQQLEDATALDPQIGTN